MNNQDAFDATQRVHLDADGHPTTPPKRQDRPTPPRRTTSRRDAQKKKQQRITLISLCVGAAVLLIALIIILVMMLGNKEEDNGLILSNVYAAGVNLGGMTPEQAKLALEEETGNTYTVLDMTVSVLDTTLKLSPADTGAKLNVDAVVKAAYDIGRTGSRAEQKRAQIQAQTSGYTISILPYLNLNTVFIQKAVDQLGSQYSTMLTQTTYSLEGERPNLKQETYDTTKVYQTLTIQLGTAEYALDTKALYQQILDAYEINLFQVIGECDVIAPDALVYEDIYDYCNCVSPINAQFNPDTYIVTDEVYGYGFSLEALKTACEGAAYGETITVDLCFIAPDITKEFYTDDMFQNTLGAYATEISTDAAWNANLNLACSLINGTIIKAGDEFSFNTYIGEPTSRRGFQSAGMYLGKSYQKLPGAGLCQVASTLYYAALLSELEILEHHSHNYVTDYIHAGFDTEIYYGNLDFRFRNNTEDPIRIEAKVEGGELHISIIGTDNRDYTVKLNYKVTETYEPGTVYNTMLEDNAGGYKDGDVIREGLEGCSIKTYLVKYSKETGKKLSQTTIGEFYYAKRDQVVVDIYEPPVIEPPPTDPSVPSDPTDPSDPSNPTDPSEPVDPDPSEPVGPDPSEPVSPDPSEPVSPDPSEPVGPNPSEPVGPDPSEPVDPDPSEPADPDPSESTDTSNPTDPIE